jgi:hypothetical protein
MKFGNLEKFVTEVSRPSIKFPEGDPLPGDPKFVEEKFPQFAEFPWVLASPEIGTDAAQIAP